MTRSRHHDRTAQPRIAARPQVCWPSRQTTGALARALLATSSVMALLAGGSGSALAACAVGTTSGYTNPVATVVPCIDFNSLNVTGNAVNAGTITPGSSFGIRVLNGNFNGSVTNSGAISVSGTGILVNGVTSLTGGITNVGTISFGAGIVVTNTATFAGGISNGGLISSPNDAQVSVSNISTFTGGITNSGRITGEESAITLSNVATFAGGILNTGTLAPQFSNAIAVNGGLTFAGGISNSGVISTTETGISVNGISNFSGGIRNSGKIAVIFENGITVDGISTFSGGIANSGTIAGNLGISLTNTVTFGGGISNGGMITAAVTGIDVHLVSTFSGGITNSGTIAAVQSGIQVLQIGTFAGGISNSGSITSQGSEAVSVATVSAFSGGITNSGTISGATGIVVRNLAGQSFSGAIVNSGNITGTNAAIDVSGAANAITINQTGGTITGVIKLSPFADVLNISGGTINGNIVGQGASNTVNFALGGGTFIYDSPFSISGVNQLNVNSGLVILNGSNSATNVAVNAGTLEVGDASHLPAVLTATNGVNVAAGGTLSGHGTVVGNIAIASGATLAPGGSIGTLNVTGNLGFAAGSFYQVAVTAAGQNSKTVATGTAAIAGGTVEVMEQPGNYPPTSKYTILTANGGVNGTFTNATSDFAFLTPVLSYDANDVFLTLNRNATFFRSLAQTPNQSSVGAALDASPLGSGVVQPVLSQTAAGARQAFDALSGEIHASVQSELIDDSLYARQAILGRLRQAGFAHAPDTMAALGFAGPDTVNGSGASEALGYAAAGAFPAKAPPAAKPTFGTDVAYWAQGVGATGHIDGDGNAASAQRDLAGFFTGFDARFGEFARIGLLGGYTHSSLSVDARASSANIDTAHLGAYAGATFGALNLRGGATYGFHTIDTSRTIAFPGFLDGATAHYDGGTGQVFGEIGYGVALGRFAAEPFAGLAWVHLETGSFAETGGVAALNGSSSTNDVGYSTLGGRVATSYLLGNGMVLTPRASAAWQHAFEDIAPLAALAFQNTGAGFAIAGVPLARDSALVETGLDLRVNPHAKLGLSYSGQLAGHLQDHAVKGNFTWNF